MFWIAVAVVFVVLGTVLFARQQRLHDEHQAFIFKRRPAVFSPSERLFLEVLELATGKDFRVLGKVRVSDLLTPQDGMSYGARTAALKTTERMHFDFVLCKPRDMTVLCVIELSDRTNKQKNQKARDSFLAEACHGAGLPLITFDARYAYSPSELSARIAEAISATLPQHAGRALHSFDTRGPLSIGLNADVALLRPPIVRRDEGARGRR